MDLSKVRVKAPCQTVLRVPAVEHHFSVTTAQGEEEYNKRITLSVTQFISFFFSPLVSSQRHPSF